MRNNRSKAGIIVLSIIMIIAIAIPFRAHMSKLIYKMDNYLPQNIYINNIHFGGKTLQETAAQLEQIESEQLIKPIVILYDDGKGFYQSSSFTYVQLGYYAEKDKILEQLNILMDKKQNLVKRIIQYRGIERSMKDYALTYSIEYNKFLEALSRFDNSALKPPLNAAYKIEKDKIQIVKEEYGYIYDKEALYKELIANPNLTTAKLNVKLVKPAITADQLERQGIKELISGFTTKYDAGNVPRASNIHLAASIIDGTIVPPAGTFSFNQTVGERTVEKGFQEAGVYINGKVDTGIGGGICQVSTTLYNAVLLADLKIIERSNHSLTVPYVPLSRDAAVSWGSQDFKFVNNTDSYIYIHCKTTRNTITFQLYSTKSGKKVELISTQLAKTKAPVKYINDAMTIMGKDFVEEKGHDGYQSQLMKKVFMDGKLISSELVSKDKYGTSETIIRRGTKIPDSLLQYE